MIRRKKLVITKRSEGARTKRVKTIRTLSELTKSLGSLGADMDISMLGTVIGSAPKEATTKKSRIATALKMAKPSHNIKDEKGVVLAIFSYQGYSF